MTSHHAAANDTPSQFEGRVADALRLAGYRVSSEQLVGHAKVDLIAREVRFGREHTIAVECKHYAKPLWRDKVVSLWADWEPLIERGLVDEVLIVAGQGVAPSAAAYIDAKRGLQSQRLEDLLASSIRFDTYLSSLQAQYLEESDGLPSYYLTPADVDGNDLEQLVLAWVAGESSDPDPSQPIAVLGGYGLGKTSFALHLASTLATIRLADVTARVPILIRLQELIGEQSLEGLLGKHFTATHDAPGYSFSKFLTLNRTGNLVVILDGFDEMRQLLTWREFRHNLRELNRLSAGDARVLILGRPTAFDSDAQQRLGLHGERTEPDGTVRREPDWPDYHEIQLASLTLGQCESFLRAYLCYRRGAPVTPYEFDRLWASINSHALRDIARRPVQLRMLADILPSYTGDTDQLNLVKLYDIFIDQLIDRLIEREEDKQSRLAFSATQRRLFLRRFAYWLWTSQPTDQASVEMLPDELIVPFTGDADLEATRRDLIVGSPLERRPGERIRFPHRAFQEFLVAEELWERLRTMIATDAGRNPRERAIRAVTEAEKAVSREVSDFMKLLCSQHDEVTSSKLLVTFEGSVSARVADTLFVVPNAVDEVLKRFREKDGPANMRPWELLALTIWNLNHDSRIATHVAVRQFAAAQSTSVAQLLALYCLLSSGERSPTMADTAVTIVRRILAGESEVERISREQLRPVAASARDRAEASMEHELHRQRHQGKPKRREQTETLGASARRTIRPITKNMVLGGQDRSLRGARVGVCVGRGRLIDIGRGKFRLSGSAELQVQWLPDWGAEFLGGLYFYNEGTLSFQKLGSLFARVLGPIAFLKEWHETIEREAKLPCDDRIVIGTTSRNSLAEAALATEVLKRGSTGTLTVGEVAHGP
jgi:NACHT domain/Restriction endonuclease